MSLILSLRAPAFAGTDSAKHSRTWIAALAFGLLAMMFVPFSAIAQEAEQPQGPPHLTLIAPFEYSGGEVKELDFAGRKTAIPVIETTLANAHRSKSDIAHWVMNIVAPLLTYQDIDYKKRLTGSKRYFKDKAYKQYLDFMRQQGLLKMLDGGQYVLRTFVQEVPVFLNEGEVDGHYRWLYDVNVMLSIFERKADGYDKSNPINRRYTVTVQVGRTEEGPDDYGIIIERWEGRDRKL